MVTPQPDTRQEDPTGALNRQRPASRAVHIGIKWEAAVIWCDPATAHAQVDSLAHLEYTHRYWGWYKGVHHLGLEVMTNAPLAEDTSGPEQTRHRFARRWSRQLTWPVPFAGDAPVSGMQEEDAMTEKNASP